MRPARRVCRSHVVVGTVLLKQLDLLTDIFKACQHFDKLHFIIIGNGTGHIGGHDGGYERKSGEYVPFTGNMSGMLIAEYILRERTATGKMPENPALVTTIVTTNMARAIADDYKVKFIEVLTVPSLSASGSVASTISAFFSFASLSASVNALGSSGFG